MTKYKKRELIRRAIQMARPATSPMPQLLLVCLLFNIDPEHAESICRQYGFDPEKVIFPEE